jgi:hypothetical protein
VDKFIGELGNPTGIKCYRPFHAIGEDFLPNFLGMAGFPVLTVSEFPKEDSVVLLTESAAFDEQIVDKIKGQLMDGKYVVITSGLLKVLQNKGIQDIAEIRYTDNKAMVDQYVVGWGAPAKSDKKIMIPIIKYLTNDSWEAVSAIDGPNGWPLLHEAEYAKGSLFVLTIPDNYADLSELPDAVLSKIRSIISNKSQLYLEGPGNVSMFLYDNHTLIVESFNEETVKAKIAASASFNNLTDIVSQQKITGENRKPSGGWSAPKLVERNIFEFEIKPHSYRVFKLD